MLIKRSTETRERQEITEMLITELGERYEDIIEVEFNMDIEDFINTYVEKKYMSRVWEDWYSTGVNGKYADEKGGYDWICNF